HCHQRTSPAENPARLRRLLALLVIALHNPLKLPVLDPLGCYCLSPCLSSGFSLLRLLATERAQQIRGFLDRKEGEYWWASSAPARCAVSAENLDGAPAGRSAWVPGRSASAMPSLGAASRLPHACQSNMSCLQVIPIQNLRQAVGIFQNEVRIPQT